MKNSSKKKNFKLGIILITIVLAIAYGLDDYFYYSEMRLAETLVWPLAVIISLFLGIYLVFPYFESE